MLFSIGYATKDISTFIEQLHAQQITAVADVRSVPYSKAFHDYHQEALRDSLVRSGINYVYLGVELGPRSPNPLHYQNNQVQFDRLQQSEIFQQGIARLRNGLDKGLKIALCCAEKDPATCHRSLLIGHYLLHHQQMDMVHIHHDGELETETALEHRLMALTDSVPDMLRSECDCQRDAWLAQSRRFAYRRHDTTEAAY